MQKPKNRFFYSFTGEAPLNPFQINLEITEIDLQSFFYTIEISSDFHIKTCSRVSYVDIAVQKSPGTCF